MLRKFQDEYLTEFTETDSNDGKPLEHHESGVAAQKSFQQQVQKLADAMKALGNPFQRDIAELMSTSRLETVLQKRLLRQWSLSRVWFRINTRIL